MTNPDTIDHIDQLLREVEQNVEGVKRFMADEKPPPRVMHRYSTIDNPQIADRPGGRPDKGDVAICGHVKPNRTVHATHEDARRSGDALCPICFADRRTP